MKKRIIHILWLLLLIPCFSSCFNNIKPPEPTPRTIIAYVVANNNLEYYARNDLKEIREAAQKESFNNCRLLIFYEIQDKAPVLMEICENNDKDTIVLKTYSFENSLDVENMTTVLNDAIELAPADEYGLILWSHGMGWIPENISALRSANTQLRAGNPNMPVTKWFGQDGDYRMNIPDLGTALKQFDFRFILFDACFCASIESLYDLRKSADYIMGSPAEMLGNGYPYGDNLHLFFEEDLSLINICQAWVKFYREDYLIEGKPWPSIAISLINTSEIDSLTSIVHQMVLSQNNEPLPSTDSIQAYEKRDPHLFYDFDQCIYKYCPPNDYYSEKQLYNTFVAQMERTVIYHDCTSSLYGTVGGGGWYDVSNSCGITTYIPDQELGKEDAVIYKCNQAFYKTNWAKTIGLSDPEDMFNLF